MVALCEEIQASKILDVGAGLYPFEKATHVLDLRDEKEFHGVSPQSSDSRHWTTVDICGREPWPFPDKFFDFCICSHVLEDIRDPLWVCSEMSRVAKRGYIETPNRRVESSFSVSSALFTGWPHHRWFVEIVGQGLRFTHKTNMLNAYPELCFEMPQDWTREMVQLFWTDRIECSEVSFLATEQILDNLLAFKESTLTMSQRGRLRTKVFQKGMGHEHPGSIVTKIKRRILHSGWMLYRRLNTAFWS